MKNLTPAALALIVSAPALAHPGHTHGAEGAMHHMAWLIVPAAVIAAAVGFVAWRKAR